MKHASILAIFYILTELLLVLVPEVPTARSVGPKVNVLMQYNDLAHTGVNLNETTPNTTNLVNDLPTITTQPASQTIGSGQTATLSVVATSNNSPVNIRINSGGPAVGNFEADNYFSAGTAATNNNTISTTGVTNPAPVEVYQSERYGENTYTVPGLVPNTNYTVRLHFSENFFTSTGQRIFSVAINDTQVLTNFDIFAAAGGANIANVQEFSAVSDSNGQLKIHYIPGSANNPKSSGFEVLSNATTATQAYQWYTGNSGDISNPIVGATSSSYTTPALTTTTSYWVRISNSSGSVDSATAVVSVVASCMVVTASTDNGNGSCGSLSYAINQATAATQPTTITLNTSQIILTGPLPTLNNSNVTVTIDGGCTVQNGRGMPGSKLVAGAGAGSTGLTLANNSRLTGLALQGFGNLAVNITGNNNQITCSWLGTAVGDGSDTSEGSSGLQVADTAKNNQLGQAGLPSKGNVVIGKNAHALRVLAGGQLIVGPGNLIRQLSTTAP